MADVRCPMCGKPNPSESEVCRFCQARIKPLISPSPEISNSSPPPEASDAPSQAGSQDFSVQSFPHNEDPGTEQDQPDWLRSLRQDGDSLPSQSFSSEEDFPDWLSEESGPGLEDLLASGQEVDSPQSRSLSSEEDFPDWLSEESGPGLEDGPASGEEGDAGDWLSDFRPAGRSGSEQVPGAGESRPDWWPPGENDPVGLDDLPSGNGSAGDLAAGPAFPGGEELEALEPEQEAEPEWLPEPQDTPPVEEEPDGSVPPFAFDAEDRDIGSLRGWLEGSPDQDAEQDGGPIYPAAESAGSEPGLAPADLPSWLEAMRPVEAAAPSEPPQNESDPFVESSGPLSGLSGVLPAEPEIARLKKPSAYSVRLRVSENQQAHADIFEELIKAEGAVHPVPSRPVVSSQHLLRLSVFFVLLLSILWTMFAGRQAVSLPEAAGETAAFSDAIGSLSPGSPVLIAVDYQPGLSAEMDALAVSVLDHLMLQEAYLALVSITPTGPAQAERLLWIANARGGHEYQAGGQYANLGFIPGGPAGILGFAEAPRRMMPFSIDGDYPWGTDSLGEVSRLDHFALAVVITEDPDTARAWIEQARPSLGDIPLLMALSAQAEPFVRPYYEGYPRQVQGILTGLAGAASYENLQSRPGLARRYWDAYSFSLPLAAALILIGGAVYAGAAALANRRRSKAEASV